MILLFEEDGLYTLCTDTEGEEYSLNELKFNNYSVISIFFAPLFLTKKKIKTYLVYSSILLKKCYKYLA